MTDCGSKRVPCTWSTLYLSSTLCRIVASSQKFGAPERSRITSASFQTMPPSGFWCSWASPIMWPNSCRITPWSCQPRLSVAACSGICALSVPT